MDSSLLWNTIMNFFRKIFDSNVADNQEDQSNRNLELIDEVFKGFVDEPEPNDEYSHCISHMKIIKFDESKERHIANFNECINLYPKVDIGYLRLAKEMNQEKKIEILNTGLAKCYRKSLLLLELGQIYLDISQWDNAIINFTSSIYASMRHPYREIGEAYMYLSLFFFAEKAKNANLIYDKGSRLSGISMDSGAIVNWVSKIKNSKYFIPSGKMLLIKSDEVLSFVEEPFTVEKSEISAWGEILLQLPIKNDIDYLNTIQSHPLLKKADIKEFIRYYEYKRKPLTKIFSPISLQKAVDNIKEFKTIYENLKSVNWINDTDFRDLKIMENGKAMAQLFLSVNSKYLDWGNMFWCIYVIRVAENKFYVFP